MIIGWYYELAYSEDGDGYGFSNFVTKRDAEIEKRTYLRSNRKGKAEVNLRFCFDNPPPFDEPRDAPHGFGYVTPARNAFRYSVMAALSATFAYFAYMAVTLFN